MEKTMKNIERLTKAGIIPEGYNKLSEDEKATINSLTNEEVEAVISASAKIHPVMEKHAAHGMAY